jgi:hypothetical protein
VIDYGNGCWQCIVAARPRRRAKKDEVAAKPKKDEGAAKLGGAAKPKKDEVAAPSVVAKPRGSGAVTPMEYHRFCRGEGCFGTLATSVMFMGDIYPHPRCTSCIRIDYADASTVYTVAECPIGDAFHKWALSCGLA